MSVVNGVNSLNKSKLLMNYKTNQTLNENFNDLLVKSNSNDIVITDMATPDMKYIVLFDELYETETRTKIGNFWDSIDNIKLFLEHAYSTATNIPKDIRESYVRDLKSIVINESEASQDLLFLKESLRQFIHESWASDAWSGVKKGANWVWGGVKDAAKYVKDSAVQLVTGTTSMVTGAAKGIWQAAGAIMRGDLQKLWKLLTSGFLAFGRYIRTVMYNPIGSIIDAILVFTGVGKAVQWIPWAIIVAVDIYEVINDDFELIPGDSKDPWIKTLRAFAIGMDIVGLVTTGAAALSGRAMLNTLKGLPKEQVAQYLAKNPSFKNYVTGMLNGVGKVPGFLQKAVDLIKPFLPGVAKFLTNMLGNFSKLVNMLKQGLMSLTVKQGLKIAGKELAIDYGAQKAIETGLSMSQKGKEGQAAAAPSQFGGGEAGGAGGGTTYSPPQELPKPDVKTKSFVSDIITNY